MPEPFKEKRFFFEEGMQSADLQLGSIGYHDFHYIKPIRILHKKGGYTLHLVAGGKGRLVIGDREYQLSAGDVFFLPPDESLMYYPDDEDPWRYYWFFLSGNKMRDLAGMMHFTVDAPTRKFPVFPEILKKLEFLYSAELGTERRYFESLSALTSIIGALCISENENSNGIPIPDIVRRAKEAIELNYQNLDFSIEMLARMLHISHSYLCKLFREETGVTIVRYMVDLRLAHAAELLAEGKEKIKDVGILSGFHDNIHFMKEFKRRYNMTAGEYRKHYSD